MRRMRSGCLQRNSWAAAASPLKPCMHIQHMLDCRSCNHTQSIPAQRSNQITCFMWLMLMTAQEKEKIPTCLSSEQWAISIIWDWWGGFVTGYEYACGQTSSEFLWVRKITQEWWRIHKHSEDILWMIQVQICLAVPDSDIPEFDTPDTFPPISGLACTCKIFFWLFCIVFLLFLLTLVLLFVMYVLSYISDCFYSWFLLFFLFFVLISSINISHEFLFFLFLFVIFFFCYFLLFLFCFLFFLILQRCFSHLISIYFIFS